MNEPRVSSRDKRARFRGTLVNTQVMPNRQQRRALAKVSVAKFKDELILAGYDPKDIEKKLAGWNGDAATDPLEPMINPKREDQLEVELAASSKRDWLHRFDEVKS